MRKKLLALGLAAVFAISMVGCGTKDKTSSDNPVYLIGTDTTFSPFVYEENGQMVGIDMEILEAVAEDQGFDYELQVLGFNAAVLALETNQVDGVIAGMSITDERKKKFDFSDPYFDSGVVMAVQANNTDINSYEDLKGKRVAIKTGTEGATFAESIAKEYGFEVVHFDESANMYQDVLSGNSVACFEDYPVMGYAISQGVELRIATEKEAGNSYGFAVQKDNNQELLEKFNQGLKNIKDNGKYQEILDKYIKE